MSTLSGLVQLVKKSINKSNYKNDNNKSGVIEYPYNGIKNNDLISINLFGKDTIIRVICTGDNKFDDNGNYKDGNFLLNNEEIEVLKWFIDNIKIEDYKKEILDFSNDNYESYCDTVITLDDVENEVDITAVAINVTKNSKSKDGFVYPEISFYGWCLSDEEHGICIGFRDKQFIGIHGQDWTL